MRKKKPHEVASKEAWEEAGVRGRIQKKAWGHYTYVKKLDDGELEPAMVQVHIIDVQTMKAEFPECKQRRLEWFSPAVAASAVGEPELGGLIANSNRARTTTRRPTKLLYLKYNFDDDYYRYVPASWGSLRQAEKNALIKAGLFMSKGRTIK